VDFFVYNCYIIDISLQQQRSFPCKSLYDILYAHLVHEYTITLFLRTVIFSSRSAFHFELRYLEQEEIIITSCKRYVRITILNVDTRLFQQRFLWRTRVCMYCNLPCRVNVIVCREDCVFERRVKRSLINVCTCVRCMSRVMITYGSEIERSPSLLFPASLHL